MKTTDWQNNKYRQWIGSIFGFLLITALSACGGSGDGGGATIPASTEPAETDTWQKDAVRQLNPGGLLTPDLQARTIGDERIYLAWFDNEDTLAGNYNVHILSWQLDGPLPAEDETPAKVATTDNCKSLALTVDPDENPAVAYQGGEVKDCGGEEQADVMLGLLENHDWVQHTGAIGFVERNPVFQDGLAGGDMSMAIDANGDIHLCYQFFYEGCDAMNFAYPDLHYVKKFGNAPGNDVDEEVIEGNTYFAGGGIQNNVGKGCALVLDRNDNPVVFYYAELPDGTHGLRTAIRRNGAWENTWVETGIQVEDISCAKDREGSLGVAYYVQDFIDPATNEVSPACLRYAAEPGAGDTAWHVAMVDEASLCGRYPSLAFNSAGEPAIAYYASESYSGRPLENLKLASKSGLAWDREVVSSAGNIGLYNTLWFRSDDRPVVCSYSRSDQTIYIFQK